MTQMRTPLASHFARASRSPSSARPVERRRSPLFTVARGRLTRRLAAVVFAGDRRVWLAAAVVGVPLVALIAFYCLRPRDYFTGTNSVEVERYLAPAQPGEPLCVPGLQLPAHTAGLRLALRSATRVRPALTMTLAAGGHLITSTLPARVIPHRTTSTPVFRIPETPARP